MPTTHPISRTQIAPRRWTSLALSLGLMAALAYFFQLQRQGLGRDTFVSGYLLGGLVLFLAAFNIRKRLSFIRRIGTAAMWMQVHIYAGFVSGFVFMAHIGWRIPNGAFETALALVYAATFLSGCYGLIITRVYPSKLALLRTQVVFENIPSLRNRLWNQAKQMMNDRAAECETLQRLFINRIAEFLVMPRSWKFALSPSNRECRRLVDVISSHDRYLATHEREIANDLKQIVREKDDLDFHWAIQSRLKYWLFVHLSLTASLLVLGIVHAVLAHAFGGGLR